MASPNRSSRGAVLITSAGRRVGLVTGFQHASQKLSAGTRILACDVSSEAAALYIADRHFLVPRIDDDQYVDHLLSVCEQESVALIVPTIDPELPILAAAADTFRARGTHVLVPDEGATAIAADKRATNKFLRRNRIGSVKQWSVGGEGQLPPAATGPYVIKPARGSAGIGVRVLPREADLTSLPKDYVIEVFARGREYTLDVYVDRHGTCIAVVPRERLEVRAGEVSKGITRDVVGLDKAARRIASALNLKGCVVTVQAFFHAESDTLAVIEINGRFGGGYPLALEAGANFPEWLLREHLLDEDLEPFNEWTRNLLMLRYDDAVFIRRD